MSVESTWPLPENQAPQCTHSHCSDPASSCFKGNFYDTLKELKHGYLASYKENEASLYSCIFRVEGEDFPSCIAGSAFGADLSRAKAGSEGL